jgi:actin-related protein
VSDLPWQADLELRGPLYQQIVLSGGTTLFNGACAPFISQVCSHLPVGFGQRLLNEMKSLAPPTVKIRIISPPERKYSTWIGGSILAALDTFKKMCVVLLLQSVVSHVLLL